MRDNTADKNPTGLPMTAPLASDAIAYTVDAWQRTILFWDALRQRGINCEQDRQRTAPNVLRYEFDVLMDGRTLPRPVNFGLVKIKPPPGVQINPRRRPFVVIDPRAGHGPGIGGFKAESELGVAMRAGHQCYFIGFLPTPEPGQTIEDVIEAQAVFLGKVNELHRNADGKPCVIGNCQAGWSTMMLASLYPDLCGPIIVAGTPLSYWAGVHGQNPMRYSGGLLGGSWMTALLGDLGNGTFDGAWLVANFESMNLANTLWDKQYNVWSKVDSETPRFLEFERWWSNHIMLNAEEMRYIVDNLFVGNRLATAEIVTRSGKRIDMRNIRSPILCFCSKGDDITPPQQALGWITDLYTSVDDIRTHGQTIIYAIHESVGHLGIFVSSSVGAKEHAEFSHHIDSIDALPPGLYEARMLPREDSGPHDDKFGDWYVRIEPRTLDDIRALGCNDAEDERRFAAVRQISEVTNSLYSIFMRPFVQMATNEHTARALAQMNPVRLPSEVFSPRNPLMPYLEAAADMMRSNRLPVDADNPFVRMQETASRSISQTLDHIGQMRDAAVESFFLNTFGSPVLQAMLGIKPGVSPRKHPGITADTQAFIERRIAELRARIDHGGPREAVIRALLYAGTMRGVDERNIVMLQEIREKQGHDMGPAAFKELIREQALILRIDTEAAVNAIPILLKRGDAPSGQTIMKVIQAVLEASGALEDHTHARLGRLQKLIADESPAPQPDRTTPPRGDLPVSRKAAGKNIAPGRRLH